MSYVHNIQTILRLATPEEIKGGIVWYLEAGLAAKAIAADLDVPRRIVVGVMAALSPNNKWERNVENTQDLIAAYLNGEAVESVKVSTYHAMKAKAWGILDAMPETDQEIMDLLNGQKIVSFFCNIMGHDTCTIDGHALNIARGERVGLTSGKTNIGKKLYIELQQAYADVASATVINGRKLKAFEVQAITWVTWKRLHNI